METPKHPLWETMVDYGNRLGFKLTHRPCGNLYLIDNCVDTGMTYNAASMLIQAPMITIANTNNYNYGRNY